MKNTIYEVTENTVSVRGKLIHSNQIQLPISWRDAIDPRTITVILTPVGSYQNLTVKRADSEEVIVQSNGSIPIDCYYHIFAETK
jgi:hypothetical protein